MLIVLPACLLQGPTEAQVQGLYEGSFKGQKAEARVVALGKGSFKIYLRAGEKVELEGKLEGDALSFKAKAGDPSAVFDKGSIKGTDLQLTKAARKPPTLGKAPPPGAIVILDGKNFGELVKRQAKDAPEEPWKAAADGSIEVPKGGMSSKQSIEGSFDLHVEFLCPLMPGARGQGRGNSGVYLPNGDEIQVLDSFGADTYLGGGCGGIYKYKDPDAFEAFSLASLPPLEWQTYDVSYRVEKKDGKPRLTVLHNGVKIHDDFELQKDARKGSFHFQDHGNPVRYRNIWVVPVAR